MRLTNVEYSKENVVFKKSCELAGVEATSRQASKFRNDKGAAVQFKGSKGMTNFMVSEAAKARQIALEKVFKSLVKILPT